MASALPPGQRGGDRAGAAWERVAGLKRSAGLAAIAFGPLTGASLNTARSLGPALASGQWQDFWIYVAGPFVGAPLGALAYQFVRGAHTPDVVSTAERDVERVDDATAAPHTGLAVLGSSRLALPLERAAAIAALTSKSSFPPRSLR